MQEERKLVEAAGSRTHRGYSSRDGSISRSRSHESRSWTRKGSRNAGCKPRGIGRFGHGLASKEPARIVDSDRVEGARGESVREFGLRGRIHNRNLDSFRVATLGKMRHDGRRSGTLNRELLTGLVGMLPGGRGQHEDTSFVERQRVCVQRSFGRWSRASVPRTRQRTSEIGVDSGKALPAPSLVRGGSVNSEAHIYIGPVCSIETTSIEADESE
jgi:hypothetical protein